MRPNSLVDLLQNLQKFGNKPSSTKKMNQPLFVESIAKLSASTLSCQQHDEETSQKQFLLQLLKVSVFTLDFSEFTSFQIKTFPNWLRNSYRNTSSFSMWLVYNLFRERILLNWCTTISLPSMFS